MGRLDIKNLLMTILVSTGLLWALALLGVLDAIIGWISAWIPIDYTIPAQVISGHTLTFPPIAGLVATIAIAFITTLVATAMVSGFQDKKMWTTFAVIAVLVASVWIIVPQILPTSMAVLAGSAQSVFTGTLPQSVFILG
jgi:hypothetical protein